MFDQQPRMGPNFWANYWSDYFLTLLALDCGAMRPQDETLPPGFWWWLLLCANLELLGERQLGGVETWQVGLELSALFFLDYPLDFVLWLPFASRQTEDLKPQHLFIGVASLLRSKR